MPQEWSSCNSFVLMLELIQRVAVVLSLLSLATLFAGILFAQVWRTLKRNLPRSVLAVFALAAAVATVQAQKVKYVDANARGRQTGNDWENAYREISPAVEACARAQMDGIVYVRPGTYGSVWRDNASYFEEGWLYPIDVYAVEGPSKTFIAGDGTRFGSGVYSTYLAPVGNWALTFHGISFVDLGLAMDGFTAVGCVISNCCGAANYAILENCLVIGNSTAAQGWVFSNCSLYGCTVVGNWGDSLRNGPLFSWNCRAYNSIIYGNDLEAGSCTYEACRTEDPGFADAAHGDYHLAMGSPCINAGNNVFAGGAPDLDGHSRIARRTVDIGCYEFQPTNETQTISAPVPVDFSWVAEKCPGVLASVDGDYDRAVLQLSANPMDISKPLADRTYFTIWESYVADLDPTDSNMTFRATIELIDGIPEVKGDPLSSRRKYTVLGVDNLTNSEWNVAGPESRFFKVRVDLP